MHRCRTLSSFWQFFSSRDHAWRWCGCSDHRDPGNAGYAGALMSIVTGDMVLLERFLVCGISAPVRTEHEGGTAAPSVQGHRPPQLQELRPCQSLFLASGSWCSPASPSPLPHPFRPSEGALTWVLLLSTVRGMTGQPLCCSAAGAGLWEREAKGMAPPYRLSSITLPPRRPGFPPQAFPTTVSFRVSPRAVSPPSTADLPLDPSTIPTLQLPAAVPSKGPMSLTGVCMAVGRII